jgi:hypothetical protein
MGEGKVKGIVVILAFTAFIILDLRYALMPRLVEWIGQCFEDEVTKAWLIRQRRKRFDGFRLRVKSGEVSPDNFEGEAERVIK